MDPLLEFHNSSNQPYTSPSESARRLVNGLLTVDPTKRLRSLRTLKNHAFYHHFDLESLRSKKVLELTKICCFWATKLLDNLTWISFETCSYNWVDFQCFNLKVQILIIHLMSIVLFPTSGFQLPDMVWLIRPYTWYLRVRSLTKNCTESNIIVVISVKLLRKTFCFLFPFPFQQQVDPLPLLHKQQEKRREVLHESANTNTIDFD